MNLDNLQNRYEAERTEGIRALEVGDRTTALSSFEAAHSLATKIGDSHLIDIATCNLGSVRIEEGEGEAVVPTLRMILMRNSDHESCWLAAHSIARAYALREDYRKALFYARLAQDRSGLLGRQDWIASSHNRVGNLLMCQSFFDQAIDEYQIALTLTPGTEYLRRAALLDNLGYCQVIVGNRREGFGNLFRSLRTFRRAGVDSVWLHEPHLDLCFSYLEIGRYRAAERHGLAGLENAKRLDDAKGWKNALYLLGETANLAGDAEKAQGFFHELQDRFYPDAPFMTNFLMAVDVRQLINLKV